MKNAMQLKAIIKNLSKSKKISAQILMQNFMFERFLERISLSPYHSNFILKGGLLIASIVGLDTRATMDMDITIKGYPVNSESINTMIQEICNVSIDDNINFLFKKTEPIRKDDKYAGLRASLEAQYLPMIIPLKIDITTGDKITPKEISYDFQLLFEERKIKIFAYNIETILAEKLETVISRSDQNTRPRDYYDIFIIKQLQWHNVNQNILYNALLETSKKRNSLDLIKQYNEIITIIKNSTSIKKHWNSYQKNFEYANNIKLTDILDIIQEIFDLLFKKIFFHLNN